LKSTISNFENCLKIAKKVADFVEDVAIIIKFIPFVFIEVLEDKSLKTSVR
jgi:small-conductance mechanosensitive channel